MLAELTFDLGVLYSMLKYLLALILVTISVLTFIGPMLMDYFAKPKKKIVNNTNSAEFTRKDTGRSSDTPPPDGFAEHLMIIEQTAPNADTAVWWEYAKAEMTEAEVAIAEAKLARKSNTP